MPSRRRKVQLTDPSKGVLINLDMNTPVLVIKMTVSEDARSDEIISVENVSFFDHLKF